VNAVSTGSLYAGTEGGLLQCSGTGVISGWVRDAVTSAAIDGALVYTDFGVQTYSVNGEYMMVSPAGIFNVTAVAPGHANLSYQDVPVFGGDVQWMQDLAMAAGTPEYPSASGSTDTSGGGGGCFIATAAYGSALAEHVKILKQFRDTYLLPNQIGQKLVALYYRKGKPAAMFIESHPYLKLPVRMLLYPVVGFAWLTLYIHPMMVLFLCGIFVAGLFYIVCQRSTSSRHLKS
jgi:hypothetical protein